MFSLSPGPKEALRPVPQPSNVKVVPAPKRASVRNVKDPITKIEDRLRARLKPSGVLTEQAVKAVRSDCLDLMYLARDAKMREKVVRFLASLVKDAEEAGVDELGLEACCRLIEMSYSLSFQDVQLYPAATESDPVVLVCSFAGSHIDDVRPLCARWATHYSASVLVCAPACEDGQRRDQLEALYGELQSQLRGERPLIIHAFSNGGFSTASQVLLRWSKSLAAGRPGTAPAKLLRGLVLDSVGAVAAPGLSELFRPFDGAEPAEASAPADTGSSDFAVNVWLGCGFALLRKYGLCREVWEEPGPSFEAAARRAAQDERFLAEQAKKPGPGGEGMHLLHGVPTLMIASRMDFVVPFWASELMAAGIRGRKGRAKAVGDLHPSAAEELLGQDGVAIHFLEFHDSPHCRHFDRFPAEYAGAIDGFAPLCLA